MTKYYAGKSVLITGASSGIGAAMATLIAGAGGRVALLARRAERLDQVRDRIKSEGGEAISVICDVRDPNSIQEAVSLTVEAFGGIDIAIANAGFGVAGPFLDLTTEDFRRQFEVNVFGVIDTTYAVMPHLLQSKGQLAVTSSVLGRIGMPATGPYSASKFAVYGLAQCLYYEFRSRGVAVTCILPGIVESEIRSVDNRGVYHAKKKDPASKWLKVPTDIAAKEIVRRLPTRDFELVITGHGKAIVWLDRHFPRTFRAIGRYAARKNMDPLEKKTRTRDLKF
jgi:short-subunit dehydrogenase